MSVAQVICDKAAIIDHGEIVERGVSEIFANPKVKGRDISIRETGAIVGFSEKLGDNRKFHLMNLRLHTLH